MPSKKKSVKPKVKAEDKEEVLKKVEAALEEKEDTIVVEETTRSDVVGSESETAKLEQPPVDTTELGSNESIFAKPPEDGEARKKNRNTSLIIIIICISIISLLAGFMGGYFYAKNIYIGGSKSSKTARSELITPTPTPTKAQVDLSLYKIQVLNGSGIGGVASTEQTALAKDGFNVANVGNAATADFKETKISTKSSVPQEFLDRLKTSLSKAYVVESSTDSLDNSSSYDVVVTLGSKTP